MIELLVAATLEISATPAECHGIDSGELSRLASDIRAAKLGDEEILFEKIGNFADYWRTSCAISRERLIKNDTMEVSSLLGMKTGEYLVVSALADVGRSLQYASKQINDALTEAKAEEKAFTKQSPVQFGGPPRSWGLRCIQIKARTGKRSERECITVMSLEPLPDEDPNTPATFEAKTISRE